MLPKRTKAPPTASVEERVLHLIAESQGVAREQLSPATKLDDLSMDSLEKVELSMHLEEEFDIQLADENADSLFQSVGVSLGDIVKLIQSLVQKQAG